MTIDNSREYTIKKQKEDLDLFQAILRLRQNPDFMLFEKWLSGQQYEVIKAELAADDSNKLFKLIGERIFISKIQALLASAKINAERVSKYLSELKKEPHADF